MTDFNMQTGAPVFLQGVGAPQNVQFNYNAFFGGNLIIYYDKDNAILYWLISLDENTFAQTWTEFPIELSDMLNICVLPYLGKLYWAVSTSAPTNSENIPATLLDKSYSVYWWDRIANDMYLMTDWDSNAGTQVWTKLTNLSN